MNTINKYLVIDKTLFMIFNNTLIIFNHTINILVEFKKFFSFKKIKKKKWIKNFNTHL